MAQRLRKPSWVWRSPSCRQEQFIEVEDAPRAVDLRKRSSPKKAVCAPCYGPDGPSPALSKVICCFPTAKIVPEVISPNKCLAHTGPSRDLPTTSPLLVLLRGMAWCDFSREIFKPPSVLSSHESFQLRQSKREGQRHPREPKTPANEQNQRISAVQ